MQELLQPVVERAREAAIEEAKQEAESNAITNITAQLAAQQAQGHEGEGAWKLQVYMYLTLYPGLPRPDSISQPW